MVRRLAQTFKTRSQLSEAEADRLEEFRFGSVFGANELWNLSDAVSQGNKHRNVCGRDIEDEVNILCIAFERAGGDGNSFGEVFGLNLVSLCEETDGVSVYG